MKYLVKIFLPLLLISAAVAGVVSGINLLTAGKIAENEAMVEAEKEATKLEIIRSVFGEDAEFTKIDDLPEGIDHAMTGNGGECCITLTTYGYNKTEGIQLFVAFDADGKIVNVTVLSSSETTGIGTKTADPAYLAGYNGTSGSLAFGGSVDKIAGATLSSRAVLNGVNSARRAMQSIMGEAENE